MTRTYKADYAAVATALGLDPDAPADTALAAVAALKATASADASVENERNTERARADGLAAQLATIRVELLKRRDRVRAVGANQAFADMTAVADMIP